MKVNNLLTDPVFQVQLRDLSTINVSLPQLLALLSEDNVASLPGLRTHQEDIVHIFLTSIAAGVLSRKSTESINHDEKFWYKGLLDVGNGNSSTSWSLVVEDHRLPAFLQPPIPKAPDPRKDVKAYTPDELDVLQTAKNHDLKMARGGQTSAEAWAYSLICLQTSSGVLGKGNYGIARMNLGFGNRPCVGLIFEQSFGNRFCRDVKRLLEIRSDLLSERWPFSDKGILFTWESFWDGTKSFSLKELDPFFIETSRMIRLISLDSSIVAAGFGSKVARVHAKELHGVVGDPWTPIDTRKKSAKSLTITDAGFTPQLLRDLLFEDGFVGSKMQLPSEEEMSKPCVFHASALVRGQGVTGGFHVIDLPIPPNVSRTLFRKLERKTFEELSKAALQDASIIQNKVLSPSLYCLLEGGPESINFNKRELSSWIDSCKSLYSTLWADKFFVWLWESFDTVNLSRARDKWVGSLLEIGAQVLHQAQQSMPVRSGRGYKSIASAESRFYSSFYKNFPNFKKEAT